jgi:leucyl-tRNA synthetase
VLIGYGSGAIMAVPAHDGRDYGFAKEFNLTIRPVIESDEAPSEGAFEGTSGKMINSGFLNGLTVEEAVQKAMDKIEEQELGERQINYKLRDANFSRQRYWGEPFPIVYKDGMPYPVAEADLPVELPEMETFKPTGTGESPLASAYDWVNMHDGSIRETDTMPGFAGSSWYFLRFMDPHNNNRFVSKDAENYWRKVDLYIGGTEHAVGHLMYARFFQKFLYDLGYVSEKEPFRKLINQGMIQGRSNFVYRLKDGNKFVSKGLKDQYETVPVHTDVNIVEDDVLDVEAFKSLYPDYKDAEFILEDGQYICGWDIEKMSKSKYNVVNPDDLIQQYGADSFRIYEMFLGPVDQHKPWEPKGIEGVYRFLNKFWRLFHDTDGNFDVSGEEPDKEELTTLHKTLKKVEEDIARFAFNTAVSSFMVCVNDLTKKGCNKRQILEPLVVAICPYAPHMAEELWHRLGYQPSVVNATFPAYNEEYIKEDTYAYPVSINGKTRTKIELPLDLSQDQVEEKVLQDDVVQKWTKGEQPKKVIYVPGRIINLVV